jgi:hypothetical protein
MIVLDKALKILSDLTEFFKKNPKFFLGVIFMLMISLLFKQCDTNMKLKKEIERQEVITDNERARFKNNVDALTDEVKILKDEKAYFKTILRVRDGELAHLDANLKMAKEEVERLLKENKKNGQVKNIFITKISSDISTNDVMTHVGKDSSGNTYVGISDSNQVFAVNTKTWFKLTPEGNEMKLSLVDKYGDNRSSLLNHSLNFSLSLSQVEMNSNTTKVFVQVKDKNGNTIPRNLLDIPFINGVDFIEVKAKEKEVPAPIENKNRFGFMVGLGSGLYNVGNNFQPGWGVGVMLGYKLF